MAVQNTSCASTHRVGPRIASVLDRPPDSQPTHRDDANCPDPDLQRQLADTRRMEVKLRWVATVSQADTTVVAATRNGESCWMSHERGRFGPSNSSNVSVNFFSSSYVGGSVAGTGAYPLPAMPSPYAFVARYFNSSRSTSRQSAASLADALFQRIDRSLDASVNGHRQIFHFERHPVVIAHHPDHGE